MNMESLMPKKGELKRFCINGHNTLMVGRDKSGKCKLCVSIQKKKRYEKNKQKILQRNKEWREKNREKVLENGVAYYKNNLEKRKQYLLKNKAKIKEQAKKRREAHKEEIKMKMEKYRKEHEKEIKATAKEYRQKHRDKIRMQQNERILKKLATDPIFKLKFNLRKRLNVAIKNNYKSGSAVKDLGCTIEFLKQYIEAKFYSNMTWDNWGTVWELDHIIPLRKFDLTHREQLLKAVNYSNLQPLTIEDHMIKSISEAKEKAKLKL